MVRNPIKTAFALCALVFVAACTGEAYQETPIAAAKPAAAPADDAVVAKVLGDTITEKQVINTINQMAQRRQLSPQQMQQRNIVLFKDAVDTLVGIALLRNEARTEKLTADKTLVEATYQGIVKNFPSETEFKKALDSQGMTETALRSTLEENLLNQQILDNATKSLPAVADAEVQKFYDGNPQYFDRPEQVHAAHILLGISPAITPEKKAEIRKKLEGIRADIESKKITFSDAAVKFSDDKTNAAKGGDLGFFPRGAMVKPFADAAFSTKPGELSQVVETQFGYHLISVIELKPAGKVSLDESKQNIQSFLANQAKQAAIQKFIDGLRAKTTVEILISEEQWKQRHSSN